MPMIMIAIGEAFLPYHDVASCGCRCLGFRPFTPCSTLSITVSNRDIISAFCSCTDNGVVKCRAATTVAIVLIGDEGTLIGTVSHFAYRWEVSLRLLQASGPPFLAPVRRPSTQPAPCRWSTAPPPYPVREFPSSVHSPRLS
jgi:hypothetical protein